MWESGISYFFVNIQEDFYEVILNMNRNLFATPEDNTDKKSLSENLPPLQKLQSGLC